MYKFYLEKHFTQRAEVGMGILCQRCRPDTCGRSRRRKRIEQEEHHIGHISEKVLARLVVRL